MDSTQQIIRKVKNGSITDLELENYLMINNMFVLSNVMKEVVKRQLLTPKIKHRLIELIAYRSKDHLLIGVYTVGHLSIATLVKLGCDVNKISEYKRIKDFDKKLVDDLSKAYAEVL